MIEPLDPRIAEMLDAFTVPDIPSDFPDRMVVRALAAPVAEVGTMKIAKLAQMRPQRSRWVRVVTAGTGLLAAGMLSVSAAAMGYLGEPLRQAVTHAIHHMPMVDHVLHRIIPYHRTRHSGIANGPAHIGGLPGSRITDRPDVGSRSARLPAIGGALLPELPARAWPSGAAKDIHLRNRVMPEPVAGQIG